MPITQVIITAWSWRKITFENCLPCPAKSPWILTRSHFEVLLIAPSLLHNTHSTTFTCKFLAIINVGIWEPEWIKNVPLFYLKFKLIFVWHSVTMVFTFSTKEMQSLWFNCDVRVVLPPPKKKNQSFVWSSNWEEGAGHIPLKNCHFVISPPPFLRPFFLTMLDEKTNFRGSIVSSEPILIRNTFGL